MPRANDDYVLVPPRNDTVSIARIVHVGERLKLPTSLIDTVDRLQVSFCVCYAASSDKDLPSNLDGLAVPNVRDLLISEHSLFFGPCLHVEQNHVVVIEEMQAYFSKLNFYHTPDCARNLLFIVELVKHL